MALLLLSLARSRISLSVGCLSYLDGLLSWVVVLAPETHLACRVKLCIAFPGLSKDVGRLVSMIVLEIDSRSVVKTMFKRNLSSDLVFSETRI